MEQDPTDPRPAYRRIADDLRTAITGRELKAGQKLPSERELVQRYAAAHATVRRALSVLQNEGLVVPRQGRGVFVRPRPLIHRLDTTRLAVTEARRQGKSAEVRLLDVRMEMAPPLVVQQLRLPAVDEQVICRRYVLFVDGMPSRLGASYFPQALSDTLLAESENLTPGQIDKVLGRFFDLRNERFTDEVSARMPTVEEARSLGLLPATPVLDVWRTYRDATDRPFEVAHFVLAADRHSLIYGGRSGSALRPLGVESSGVRG